MPRTRATAAAAKPAEPVKPFVPEDQVPNDEHEEMMEEEVEYEEVEEEVEEIEEEEEEVIEEEEEEEHEEEEETAADVDGIANVKDDLMKDDEMDEDERKKHAELLALPPHGSEVYIGGLPRDALAEDLKCFCESVGEVTEVRMMKSKDSSDNKCYAFVTFRTKDLAAKAIEDLNNTEFMRKKIKCSSSQAKHRLFIGNIPKNWMEDDLKKAVMKVGPGVTNVHLMKDPKNSSRNRGYAFIEYYNQSCAEYSRKKMSMPKFKLDSNSPTVSWADPRNDDSSSSSQVKAIYVKNLPQNVTEDQLEKLFEHHGEITKVVLPPAKSGHQKRYGFVHFKERSMAMKAIKDTERYEIDGDVLDCSLAKPPSDKKVESGSNAQKGPLLPNYPTSIGYGVMGGGYGALAPGLGQPMIYGRGQSPAAMAMVPMILPDGRLGYVLQQPGATIGASQQGGNRGGSSSGGRRGNDTSRGRRFHPY
ncbi:heterogeneous nuclear ribonucleoprotein Q [Typha angustifolia]|uniref:heterogeneous nuclear ribonucleoprotein Q n=1 Tax=Typha angustifolia TaxID=59011 RepID=UPI003C309CF1